MIGRGVSGAQQVRWPAAGQWGVTGAMALVSPSEQDATPSLRALPRYLSDRVLAWRSGHQSSDRAWYASLERNGQRPRTMVISCCDSRVDSAALFSAEPGELFVVRNVANLVPPYQRAAEHSETSAAIEYAVKSLDVAHIVILGHSSCGGVAACHDLCAGHAEPDADDAVFVRQWVKIINPAYEAIRHMEDARAARLKALEQAAVLNSADNLMSFPFVAARVASGKLTVHATWFDIGAAMLHWFDPVRGRFEEVR